MQWSMSANVFSPQYQPSTDFLCCGWWTDVSIVAGGDGGSDSGNGGLNKFSDNLADDGGSSSGRVLYNDENVDDDSRDGTFMPLS